MFSSFSEAGEYSSLVRDGDMAMQYEEYDRALESFQKAEALEKADDDLRVRIAIAYSCKKDWQNARRVYEEILSRNPQNIKALFNFGLMFYNSGDFVPAARWFAKLYELDPDYPELKFHIGLLFENAGEHDRARRYFIAELNTNPSCGKAWERLGTYRVTQQEEGTEDTAIFIAVVCFLSGTLLLLIKQKRDRDKKADWRR